MTAPVVASLGELLVEFVCTERNGRNLRPASYVGPFPSGAPGIFIDQAARVGARTVFSGAVGRDAFGQVLRDRLAAAGVSIRLIAEAGGPTGTAHVSYNDDGSRDFVFNIAGSAASAFPRGDGAVAGFLAEGVQVLHISGSTLGDPGMRVAALEVCEALHAHGVAISVDPNIRAELMTDDGYLLAVRRLIGIARFVLPSDADAVLLWPGEPFDVWASHLVTMGAQVVALKRGGDGAVARDGSGVVDLPGHPVEVVDPTGAGDCFCATLVTRAMSGDPLPLALARANAAGALSVQRLGPMEGNSDLAAIDAFLA